MNKHVFVGIESTIQHHHQKETIRTEYFATSVLKQDTWYIRYEDSQQGKVLVKYNSLLNTVTIIYQHHLVKRMIFDVSQKTILNFSDENTKPLIIQTQSIKANITDYQLVRLYLEYTLWDGDEKIGVYQIILRLFNQQEVID